MEDQENKTPTEQRIKLVADLFSLILEWIVKAFEGTKTWIIDFKKGEDTFDE